MASLADVIGSFTPLTVMGSEFHGPCIFESHAEPLTVINGHWRCICGAHETRDDAIGFLMLAEKIDEHGAQNLLDLTTFVPTLLKPTPPPRKYGFHRVAERPDATVLIVDSRKAAAIAEATLAAYVVCAWPDGGDKWGELEPLRNRRVMLWPSGDTADMERLEAVIADPAGLACTGKILTAGLDLTQWAGTGDELIQWAREHVRPLQNPVAQVVASPLPPPPVVEGVKAADNVVHPVAVPPATIAAPDASPEATGPSQGNAEPPPSSDTDFPSNAAQSPPRKRRLQIVGGGDMGEPAPDDEPLPAEMSEDFIADDFAAQQYLDWRYVKKWDCWYRFDGDGWRRDETELIDRLAVEQCRRANHWSQAAGLTPDQRRRIGQRRTAGQVRDLARSDRRIAATAEQWDIDPMLLGCPGGAIDLRTGKVVSGDREAYITLRTAVAPEEGEPTQWLAHLDKALQRDADTIAFLRRYLGYMLTGEVGEHCLVFFYGTGRNGKGTIVETVIKLLGDYGYAAPMNLLMESRSERHPTELASLRARRGVSASEPPEGARWDDGRIRFLTGGDTINARGMRQDPFTFEPTHKLLLMGNHIPSLRSVDPAMQARFKLIEFNYFFPPEERDIHFMDKLRAEWPRILNWMIQGCMEWQDCGLGLPEKIEQATAEYMQSEDEFGEWISENVEIEPSSKIKSSDVYANFCTWAEKRGTYVPSQKAFTRKLKERGHKTQKTGVMYFVGISLRLGANL